MIEYERSVPDSDELGPGSDLVISMFALAMLVMAIIGSGLVEPAPTEPVSVRDDISTLQSELSLLRKQKATRDFEVARLTAQLRDAELRLAIALNPGDVEAIARELAGLRQRFHARETELEAMKQRLLEAESRSKQRSDVGDVIFTAREGAGSAFFNLGSATVNQEGQKKLIESLRSHASVVLQKQYNALIVEGYASPDPPRHNRDNSSQLAFARAEAIVTILIQAGIPRRCLGIVSYGRNRSELLFGQYINSNPTERGLNDFDASYISGAIAIPSDKLRLERRTDVRAGADPRNSFCSWRELGESLRGAN